MTYSRSRVWFEVQELWGGEWTYADVCRSERAARALAAELSVGIGKTHVRIVRCEVLLPAAKAAASRSAAAR